MMNFKKASNTMKNTYLRLHAYKCIVVWGIDETALDFMSRFYSKITIKWNNHLL